MKTIKKSIFLITLLIFSTPDLMADEFDDLLILYADEEYDKCLDKAIKYMEKSNTRKEPLPYLYASMAAFEMSQIAEYREDYPKAFRDALKYATKFVRKDREKEYTNEHEWYFPELIGVTHETALNHYLDEKQTKAASFYNKIVKIDELNISAQLMLYVCYKEANLSSKAFQAETDLLEMIEKFEENKPKNIEAYYLENAFSLYNKIVEDMYRKPKSYERISPFIEDLLSKVTADGN